MGILDQLRHEASDKQESEFAAVDVQQQLENEYQERILPKLQKTYKFLKEIVEHLSYLEKGVETGNYSKDYPQIGELTQTGYKINTDGYGGLADFNRIMQVNVVFICAGKGTFTYELEGRARIEQEVAFLHSKNVPVDWNQFVSSKGVEAASFTITRKIPVRFRFEADMRNTKIKLLIHNHDDFSVYKKIFDPEDVNESLLDEVIRYMLRKDCDFIRLDINNQDKERIRKEAEALQMQQAKFLEDIHIEEEKEQQEREEAETKKSGILSVFGKSLFKRNKKS